MIPTLRSLPSPGALADLVEASFRLPVRDCVLIRSLVNDVYAVTTPERRYVLKLYRAAYWLTQQVLWEVELTGHLGSVGVPVPPVVPHSDGRLVGILEAAEGPRPFTLTEFVVGSKPLPPFSDDLYRRFGQLVARFHNAADDFDTTGNRPPADLPHRLDEPLAIVLPRLADEDRSLVRELATAARAKITQYAERGLGWGVCHGDVSLDNVLLTEDGLNLHDFDLATEGWRAADLVGVASTPHWEAFADGYTDRRPLAAVELAAIGWLRVVGSIGNLRFHLYDKPLLRGTESVSEGWAERELTSLRAAADGLL